MNLVKASFDHVLSSRMSANAKLFLLNAPMGWCRSCINFADPIASEEHKEITAW